MQQDPELKKEAEFLGALRKGIQEQDETSPGEMGLARLKRDIQREQKQTQKPQGKFWKPLAIAACCVLGVQMFLLIPKQETNPNIVTLSGNGQVSGPQLQIVFQAEASAAQIQQTLNSVQGNIISGPGALGVYTVALPGEVNYREVIAQLSEQAHVEEVIAMQQESTAN